MATIAHLQEKLGIVFKNKDLLLQALTHRSYINENPSFRLSHNERLEFLGDAVLELAVTEDLYQKFPTKPEGELTSFRASLVNAKMLSRIAADLNVGDYLLMSHGEAKDIGRGRQYILANACEAIVGAIYLDHGYQKAEDFIKKNVMTHLDEVIEKKLYKDPKSLFQEEAQDRMGITPTYEVLDEWGPDHDKHFLIGVFLEKSKIGEGEGPSKQIAQEEAARNALEVKNWI